MARPRLRPREGFKGKEQLAGSILCMKRGETTQKLHRSHKMLVFLPCIRHGKSKVGQWILNIARHSLGFVASSSRSRSPMKFQFMSTNVSNSVEKRGPLRPQRLSWRGCPGMSCSKNYHITCQIWQVILLKKGCPAIVALELINTSLPGSPVTLSPLRKVSSLENLDHSNMNKSVKYY